MSTTSTVTYCSTDAFLDAWLRGVDIAGRQWFTGSGHSPGTKWDYRPDYDLIMDNLGVLSTGEAVFLAAMYSFFNPAAGAQMLHGLGYSSPGELAARLDEKRVRVLADLMVSYEGW